MIAMSLPNIPTPINAETSRKVYKASLLRHIDAATVVSFDIFDTLFVRPLADPEDAFDILGERFHIPDFRRIRRQAQAEAFQRMALAGQGEITLKGIYACMRDIRGLPVDVDTAVLCQAELELELALTLPNPELIDVFKETAGRKRVLIVSDMYLPRSFFETLFDRYALPRVPMYISAECGMTKRDHGELYDRLIADMDVTPDKILHIGDNPVSDVARARERGLQAFHYASASAPPYAVSPTLGTSLAASLPKLHPNREVNTFYGLGYRFGGPAALGLLEWTRDQALLDEVDRVFFIARDGYILEQLAQRGHISNLPSHAYFPGSRVAFSMSAIHDLNFDSWLDFLLSGADGLSPDEVLQRIGVTVPAQRVMEAVGLGDRTIIDASNIGRVRDFLSAYRDEIIRTAIRNRRGLFNLLKAHGVESGMRIAIVDVGWRGAAQAILRSVLTEMLDVDIVGYYLALVDSPECRRRRSEMTMKALLDSHSTNATCMEKLYAHRVGVELMFSAPHGAVIGYAPEPHGKVRIIEDAGRGCNTTTLHEAVHEIQRGILDFADNYEALSKNIQYRARANELVQAILDFSQMPAEHYGILDTVNNFDVWGSSRNFKMIMSNYQ